MRSCYDEGKRCAETLFFDYFRQYRLRIKVARAFCYVDDLIDGLMRLMASEDSITGPINLGNPEEFTILQLASAIIDLTGSASRIVHKPIPQDDPRQRSPNITKANERFGWEPRTPLKEGLSKTIDYFDKLLGDEGVSN